MQKLVDGIHTFQAKYFAQHRNLFRALASEQSPETLFITCSDSRVVPNLITSTGPGELFIVRNIGNIVPHVTLPGGTAAAIEYAVELLGVRNVVVCGHTPCGGVQAMLEPERIKGMPFVEKWLGQTTRVRSIVGERYAHLSGEERLTAAVEENVLVQLENLRDFPSVGPRLERGEIVMSGWVYKIETGEVFEFDPAHGQFVEVSSRASLTPAPPPPERPTPKP